MSSVARGTLRSGGKGEEKEPGESDEELKGGVEEGTWREGGGGSDWL